MVSSLFALLVLASPQQEAAAPKPQKASEIVGKMLARYSNLSSLTGTIKMQQAMRDVKITIDTYVQYQQPSLLYVSQVKTGKTMDKWLVTSDGKYFSYDTPETMKTSRDRTYPRLVEPVDHGTSKLDYQLIYKASSASIGDRSAPLDIAINNIYDLQFLRGQWATLKLEGKKQLGDVEVNSITGSWRAYGTALDSGTFQMMITDDGDLKRYAIKQIFSLDTGVPNATLPPTEIVTQWDVDLKPNGQPDTALFKLVR